MEVTAKYCDRNFNANMVSIQKVQTLFVYGDKKVVTVFCIFIERKSEVRN